MQGVLCGADRAQEWLLPWWWSKYSVYNSYPVTFCDFGFSAKARQWCLERGEVITVQKGRAADRDSVSLENQASWEAIYGKSVWHARESWFKKPFALLSSPYDYTLWLDLDTEVLCSLAPLFEECRRFPLALLREEGGVKFNSGVLGYQKGSPLIQQWAERAEQESHLFWGDDPLLSELIAKEGTSVHELSPIWNWRMKDGFNIDARIIHWMGEWGKAYIRKYGGLT